MTRADVALTIGFLAFVVACWLGSLIVRVRRKTREDERAISRSFERVVADAAEVIESVDGRST